MHLKLDRHAGIRLLAAAFTFGCIAVVSAVQPAYAQSQVPAAKANAAATVNVQRNVYAAGGQVRPGGRCRETSSQRADGSSWISPWAAMRR